MGDAQPRSELFTTTIVEAEILYGIACLAPGHRRNALEDQARAIFHTELSGQVLPMTSETASIFADLSAERRRQGRPMGQFDALIAACAKAVGAAVATRDVAGFDKCGMLLVNPWDAG